MRTSSASIHGSRVVPPVTLDPYSSGMRENVSGVAPRSSLGIKYVPLHDSGKGLSIGHTA